MKRCGLHWGNAVAGLSGALVLLPSVADAHVGFPGMADLWNGTLHPILDIAQTLTLIGAGWVLARRAGACEATSNGFSIGFGSRRWRLDPFSVFHATVALGLLWGVICLPADADFLGPLALALVGFLLLDPRGWFSRGGHAFDRGLVVSGTMVGLAFAGAISAGVVRWVFASGVFFSVILIPLYAAALWERFHRPWFDIAARIAGSWMMAIAFMLLGGMLRTVVAG